MSLFAKKLLCAALVRLLKEHGYDHNMAHWKVSFAQHKIVADAIEDDQAKQMHV